MFPLYLVELATIFSAYNTASNMKSPNKSPVVTSDNY